MNTRQFTVRWFVLSIWLCAAAPVVMGMRTAVAAEPPDATRTAPALTAQTVAASADFATLVLRDPWDMNEKSDISTYFNESSQRNLVTNVRLEDGIFRGLSVSDAASGENAYVFPLFPGYIEAMKIGKVGERYPIDAEVFHCFYAAMRVESGPANSAGPDVYRVFWFEDTRLNSDGGAYGLGVDRLYPAAGADQPTHLWKLYRMDLTAPPISPNGFDRWTARPQWQGLRLDPTVQGDVDFQIDWIRLTDCAPSRVNVTWTPNAAGTALWVRPMDGTHYIRVATGVSGARGAYDLDVQGLAAGEYRVGLGTDSTCCLTESAAPVIVNATPIVQFIQPSYTSGVDYATQAGNPWDFSDAADLTDLRNAAGAVENGALQITTQSGPRPGGIDVQIDLNTPTVADAATYRYLSLRLYTEWDGAWQDVVSGMIGRWLWKTNGLPGTSGGDCTLVSQDIPHNVGWHVYHIDLYDYFQGAAEDTYPDGDACPEIAHSPHTPPTTPSTNPTHWLNSGSITQFRYDPNENISCDYREETGKDFIPCSDYRQELDWITLTAMDQVTQGEPFEIILDMNKPMDVSNFTFYYTTDPTQPRQNRAVEAPDPSELQPSGGPFLVYLPLVRQVGGATQPVDGSNPIQPTIPGAFQWDTGSVTAGEYYVCAEADDGINGAIYCSETPVRVIG